MGVELENAAGFVDFFCLCCARCGTWVIPESACSGMSASAFWNFNLTFEVGANPINLELAITGGSANRWILFNAGPGAGGCVDETTAGGCGTFSSTTPCGFSQCDEATQQVCQATQFTRVPTASVTHTFGIRKANNGGQCATTISAFLGGNPADVTCQTLLRLADNCPGSETSGMAGPARYAAAAQLSPVALLSMLVLAAAMLTL